jgi:hypothetical protein
VLAAAAAGRVLVVVALWLTGDGPAGLRDPGPAATSLGRLTGLVSADLLLVQVALMARPARAAPVTRVTRPRPRCRRRPAARRRRTTGR